jgi:hypothetical protein
MIKNVSEQEITIAFAEFDGDDPRKAQRKEHRIGPGQIVAVVPDSWKKHPLWASLTAANGPLQPVA